MGQYYNLQVVRGLSSARSLLSCRADGWVDLWNVDDASGRQQWVLTPVTGQASNVFNITVRAGTNQGETFLSCGTDNRTVDLWNVDDGSGRQRWVLTELVSVCDCFPIPSYYQIRPVAGATGYLSCTADGRRVDLWNQDDGSGRQRWQLQGPGFIE